MSRRNDANKDVLSKIHEQIVKDQNNDSTQTGSFPVVRRKPKRVSLNAKATRARLYSSVLVTVLCALLGFSYAIQLNNTTSTYETMSEDELTKLISETSTQVQKLEQRNSELSHQLDSLKDTADKNEKAAEIARQNAESNGILSGRLPVSGEGVVIRISKGSKRDIDASILFTLLEELRNSGADYQYIHQRYGRRSRLRRYEYQGAVHHQGDWRQRQSAERGQSRWRRRFTFESEIRSHRVDRAIR